MMGIRWLLKAFRQELVYLEPTGTLGSVIKQRPPTSVGTFPPDPWGLFLKDCVCHTQASSSYLMALNPSSPEVLGNTLIHQIFIEYVPAPCQGLKGEKNRHGLYSLELKLSANKM